METTGFIKTKKAKSNGYKSKRSFVFVGKNGRKKRSQLEAILQEKELEIEELKKKLANREINQKQIR